MATAEERIAELERQLAELKQSNVSEKREQISAHLIQSFGIDDDDIVLEHVLDHLGITETTDIDSMLSKAEDAYKQACRRAGRELPVSAAEWCEQYKQQLKENESHAQEMKKYMV